MTLVDALKQQAQSCASLGSPFMERLLNGLAANWPHGSQIDTFFATFDGDPSSYGASLPLRLAGGLHALVLTGRDPALAACYPPHEVEDAALIAAVRTAIESACGFPGDLVPDRAADQRGAAQRGAHSRRPSFGGAICVSLAPLGIGSKRWAQSYVGPVCSGSRWRADGA